MPVVDITFTKFEAGRQILEKPLGPKGIKVMNNSKVNKVRKKKIEGLGDAVLVDFEFHTKYEPKVGNITVGGTLIFFEKKLKDFVNEKKGDVRLKKDTFEEVQNIILGSSLVQAVILAKELKLPSPMQLPKVKVEETSGVSKGYA